MLEYLSSTDSRPANTQRGFHQASDGSEKKFAGIRNKCLTFGPRSARIPLRRFKIGNRERTERKVYESTVLPEIGRKVREFGSKKFRKIRNWGLTAGRTSARIPPCQLDRDQVRAGLHLVN